MYSGRPISPVQRVDWRLTGAEGLAATSARATTEAAERFRARGRRWHFGGGVTVSHSILSPHEAQVGSYSSSDPRDDVLVVYVRSGRWRITDNGESFDFSTGDVAFTGATRPALGLNLSTSGLTVVRVPRETVAELGGTVPDGVGGFRSSALADPTLAFIQNATADDAPVAAQPTGHLIGQLVAGLFIEAQSHQLDSSDLMSGLWARAQSIIRLQFGDADLTPTRIASQLNVSVRHVQRAFALTGQTAAEEIRERRLEAAVVQITTTSTTFTEIAARTGFASAGELRRALRTVHGITATELRLNPEAIPPLRHP